MAKKRKILCTLLISLSIIASITSIIVNTSAHSPRYVDLKYYEEDEVLSVYITHGVSNSSYHYVETVIIEFYELDEAFKSKFSGKTIVEADVPPLESLNGTTQLIENYTSQGTHQIFHYNYSIYCPEWTLIVVTAICNLGGSFTQSLISGHPYYDPEHSMIEALVPTIICSIVTMTPLALWGIFSKRKEDVKQ